MPVLDKSVPAGRAYSDYLPGTFREDYAAEQPSARRAPGLPARASRLFPACSHAGCGSGRVLVWRSRTQPVFEGGWCCSPACLAARVEAAVARELRGRVLAAAPYRHRVPIGLVLLERGWITVEQHRRALELQRAAGHGRLGEWLVRRCGVPELAVTRALALQWSCPVFQVLDHHPERLAALAPRLLWDAFHALPLRIDAGRILYLGFEHGLDPCLSLALERMTGLRVESGVVPDHAFAAAHARQLKAGYAKARVIEAARPEAMVAALADILERERPLQARLVRVHDFLWLRLFKARSQGPLPARGLVEDVLCALALPA